MEKIKLTTTSKASTAMLYDLIKTNAVLSRTIHELLEERKDMEKLLEKRIADEAK
tara:strand:- start:443 stop:607 length:165 start_codon:yes stop_codon:yes gene_type:complete